ncbi:single-stranded DNA-binding protein [Bifidobacterium tibiigranuli]|jgi:single-strand DNA-binding protein|uniref:single-stranded DNA-binding protein n=1 Tax=Bifidobacterium tibiigranuli TaxID=2172043 RepID=UPI0026EBD296|nr:single-stranded DNA-binding protein [Bifidobacterium tibiigranuli]MCI1713228.1 single-stranded DNA-binding protein [Bifidobacterium tibiigranuli]
MAGETTLTIVGNLTADPEVRTIGSGASVANFTIASTPRTFNRDTNQFEDGQALFMRCAAWRELADHVASSLSKGMRVIAQGRISQRSYQANDGTNRTVVEMTVDEIGPSLRYATAQVTRQSSGSGFSGNRNSGGNGGNGGYQGGAGYSGGSGYSGGASAPSQSAPVADPWGSPAQSNGGGFSSFGGSSDFGGDGDEPEF